MTKHKGRLYSFRGGDRSEYLSLYILTRLAYVNPVPRQEDFGVADFFCFLGKQTGKYMYGEDAFILQVKSSNDSFDFGEDATSYLKYHADVPFLLSVTDKSNRRMQIYSSWRLWYYLMQYELFEIKSLRYTPNVFTFDVDGKPQGYKMVAEQTLEIALGEPILSLALDDTNIDTENAYRVLKFWLRIERSNLVGLRTHMAFFQGVKYWETDKVPSADNVEVYYGTGMDRLSLEKATADCLTALAFKYSRKGSEKPKALHAISEALGVLPDMFLNDMGRNFKDKPGRLG